MAFKWIFRMTHLDKWICIHPSFPFQGVHIFRFGYFIHTSSDHLFNVIFCSKDLSSLYLTRWISSSCAYATSLQGL
uniref:Uncharacterized protein n=1 Tax=Lepeophtheirus salmonis TaxID=72036 RepID=A0A0K2TF93_LEPSM